MPIKKTETGGSLIIQLGGRKRYRMANINYIIFILNLAQSCNMTRPRDNLVRTIHRYKV